ASGNAVPAPRRRQSGARAQCRPALPRAAPASPAEQAKASLPSREILPAISLSYSRTTLRAGQPRLGAPPRTGTDAPTGNRGLTPCAWRWLGTGSGPRGSCPSFSGFPPCVMGPMHGPSSLRVGHHLPLQQAARLPLLQVLAPPGPPPPVRSAGL